MNCAFSIHIAGFKPTLPLAAYQVGLSFLTNHMRRAVAACTSPEVFFGANVSGVSGESALLTNNFPLSDPLAYAMENLDISISPT